MTWSSEPRKWNGHQGRGSTQGKHSKTAIRQSALNHPLALNYGFRAKTPRLALQPRTLFSVPAMAVTGYYLVTESLSKIELLT